MEGIAKMFERSVIPGDVGSCCVSEVDFDSSVAERTRYASDYNVNQTTGEKKEEEEVLNDEDSIVEREYHTEQLVQSPTDKTKQSSFDEDEVSNSCMKVGPLGQGAANDSDDPPGPYPVTRQGSSFRRRKQCPPGAVMSDIESNNRIKPKADVRIRSDSHLHFVLYISASAIIGSCIRVYLSRIFGKDCETESVNDFLTPLSAEICVTSGGRTTQTGGALFWDLPANLLGSFIMGFITPKDASIISRLPWLKQDHSLQNDDVYHTSLGVGLCGCMTTFASWNTQMVAMLDGTHCANGFQIIPALFGYMLGMVGATSSFRFGRDLAVFLHTWRNPAQPSVKKEAVSNSVSSNDYGCSISRNISVVVVVILFALFLLGSVVHDIQFYRQLLMMSLIAPFGAILRWRLSAIWNGGNFPLASSNWKWLPWGTFAANMLGATVSILCTGFQDRYDTSNFHPWIDALIFALGVGFAGSLSTVSSMVKEIVALSEKYSGHAKSYIYGSMTVLTAMFTSLFIYMSIVRP